MKKNRNNIKSNYEEIERNIFSEKEAADIYGVCTRTLSNLRKKGELQVNKHYFYVGKQVRYCLNQLQDYFELESERKLQQL